MIDYEPASRYAQLAAGIVLFALLSMLILGTSPPPATGAAIADAPRTVRSYLIASAAGGLALNGTLAASFLIPGGTALRAGLFPAPGYGLPWRSRRVSGGPARAVGAFMLCVGTLQLLGLRIDIRGLGTAVSLH